MPDRCYNTTSKILYCHHICNFKHKNKDIKIMKFIGMSTINTSNFTPLTTMFHQLLLSNLKENDFLHHHCIQFLVLHSMVLTPLINTNGMIFVSHFMKSSQLVHKFKERRHMAWCSKTIFSSYWKTRWKINLFVCKFICKLQSSVLWHHVVMR